MQEEGRAIDEEAPRPEAQADGYVGIARDAKNARDPDSSKNEEAQPFGFACAQAVHDPDYAQDRKDEEADDVEYRFEERRRGSAHEVGDSKEIYDCLELLSTKKKPGRLRAPAFEIGYAVASRTPLLRAKNSIRNIT